MYKILIEKKAIKFLSKLDSKSYRIISDAIRKLSNFHQTKNLDIKLLKGKYKNMFRLRIGSRRILFTADEVKKEMKPHGLTPVVPSPLASAERNPAEAENLRIHPRPYSRGFLRRRIKIWIVENRGDIY